MFEVSSLRTNTSSKSFAPLISSHVNSRLFKATPNFNQPLLQFVDGVDFPLVYTTLMHDSPDLVINWIEIWTVCRPQIWRNEVWCFSMQNLQFRTNIHTSVSFTRWCSNKVQLQWEIFNSCYEPFLSDSDIERILKIDQHLPKLP